MNLGPISFIFVEFSAKILPINRFWPKLRGWGPSLEMAGSWEIKSWEICYVTATRLIQDFIILMLFLEISCEICSIVLTLNLKHQKHIICSMDFCRVWRCRTYQTWWCVTAADRNLIISPTLTSYCLSHNGHQGMQIRICTFQQWWTCTRKEQDLCCLKQWFKGSQWVHVFEKGLSIEIDQNCSAKLMVQHLQRM